MQVDKTAAYLNTRKKLIKSNRHLEEKIKEAELLLETNHLDSSLDYKKIICKKDKTRHSIKISNTQYRILLSHEDDTFILVCVCTHDRYQIKNKNC